MFMKVVNKVEDELRVCPKYRFQILNKAWEQHQGAALPSAVHSSSTSTLSVQSAQTGLLKSAVQPASQAARVTAKRPTLPAATVQERREHNKLLTASLKVCFHF
jgi:hypothetical protein